MDITISNPSNFISSNPGNKNVPNKIENEPKTEKETKPVKSEDSLKISATGKSMREERPLTVSGNFGIPNGLSLDVNYNINDRFSVGGGVGTVILADVYSAHGRFYFAGWERLGLYTETGLHLLEQKPFDFLTEQGVSGIATQTVGAEFRARNGFTINADIGKGMVLTNPDHFSFTSFKVGVGYSF